VRFSKPVYESLPWLYSSCGAAALVAGYRLRTGASATLISLGGLIVIIAGVAVWLRRRDARARSAAYRGGQPPVL
jgi:LPXTG-motif cell wall-anchored protein